MPFIFRAENYEAPLKPGLYSATLRTIEERQNDGGGYLVWKFAVHDGHGRTVEVGATSSAKCTPKAKARGYVEGLLGRPMKPDEAFTPAMLYGKPCQVVVSIQTYDDGGCRNTVEKVLPVGSASMGDDDVPF